MSKFSIKTFLPCVNIVKRCCSSLFPNAIAREIPSTIAQHMAQKPYQRFHHQQPSFHLPTQYQHLLFDGGCSKRSSDVLSNVTKRVGKTSKSSDSPVIRKNRRNRTYFTKAQIFELEHQFMQCNYVDAKRADLLAAKLSLNASPVKFWFKNKRQRVKVKETTNTLQNDGPRFCSKVLSCKGLHAPSSMTPSLASSSTIADIETPFSLHPIYDNNGTNSTVFTRLQKETTSTPTQFGPNTKSKMRAGFRSEQILQPQSHQKQLTSNHVLERATNHEPTFNFNDTPLHVQLPSPIYDHELKRILNNSDSDYFSQISSNSEIYEGLAPNSLENGSDSVFNGILDSLRTPEIHEKLTSTPEAKFNSQLDTIWHQSLAIP